MHALRALAPLMFLLMIAGCGGGDSDVEIVTGSGTVPEPGTFRGTTSGGADMSIQVGGIEQVGFTCGNTPVLQVLAPPAPIRNDGTFDVRFESAGRGFRVSGRFATNDTGAGRIEDDQHQCDDVFDVARDPLG